MVPADYVAERIAARYGHPARVAHLYLFRLKPDSDLTAIVPSVETVLTAWVDEGSGLGPTSAARAIEQCQAVYGVELKTSRPTTPLERRRQMARSVLFTVEQPDVDSIEVQLMSRALAFSPKGDRAAHEVWHRSGEGWYSAYQPHADQ
ncbi:MAG: hypothetical protein ABI947_17075 [Chloroflexota bacterium]